MLLPGIIIIEAYYLDLVDVRGCVCISVIRTHTSFPWFLIWYIAYWELLVTWQSCKSYYFEVICFSPFLYSPWKYFPLKLQVNIEFSWEFFVVCTSQFVVMFTGSDGSGCTKHLCNAYISQSTRGLRSLLREHVRSLLIF